MNVQNALTYVSPNRKADELKSRIKRRNCDRGKPPNLLRLLRGKGLLASMSTAIRRPKCWEARIHPNVEKILKLLSPRQTAQIWFHQSSITFLNTSFPHCREILVRPRRLKLIGVIAERIGTSHLHRNARLHLHFL